MPAAKSIPAYARSYELSSPQLVFRTVGKLYFALLPKSHHSNSCGRTDDVPRIDIRGVKNDWAGIWLVNELM
ncbi:hypothetical protein CROQUDRAFT_86376 [Cronartium quercuum f. sp. fusiforme G11]|uniref:Uncharacterized protein n=1 Tax=Cronartium quercuum f. sp. fusiforme G11 TaxID=708437 RepID=A0A9P6NX11_9BASI|nr:hypothetical protein CROQUDRAFT_86376 [Cronartium quercuum f. sp. fusiforme G11]